MKTFICSVAQSGYFAGPVHFINSITADSTNNTIVINPENEIERFYDAVKLLKCNAKKGDIYETVLAILSDEAFTSKVEAGIKENRLAAGMSIKKAADDITESFNQMESDYLRARKDDIEGAANKIISIINNENNNEKTALAEVSAFVSDMISPAELISADDKLIGALLTTNGSVNSHAAILAGNLGIPYLYGNSEAVEEARKSDFIIIDSAHGTVITDPDDKTLKEAKVCMQQAADMRAKHKADTLDEAAMNCRTKVYANISSPNDIEALISSNADGVGLFRTEFLFIDRDFAPDEEEQFSVYKAILEAMGDKPVVIRTIDIGSDKNAPWFAQAEEPNPALGLRGVRVSLENDELFRTQLRALLRASVYGNLKVMFPMIASGWEIDEIVSKIEAAALELDRDGIARGDFEIGIMVETPAAAVCAEELAEKVNFFSIGTNDLAQYALAIDREANGLDRYFDPHHEAIYKLIELTAEGAHKHGVSTCLCGQLGADPEAIDRLIEIKLDSLSVPIAKINETKRLVSSAEKRLADAADTAPAEDDNYVAAADDNCVAAAADGEIIPMQEIPDEVFSQGTLGPCFGIMPSDGNIYAPAAGVVSNIADSKHAVTIAADDGTAFLVHVGIGTVKLNGAPFHLHVQEGMRIEQNQLIITADLAAINQAGLSPMVIIVKLVS